MSSLLKTRRKSEFELKSEFETRVNSSSNLTSELPEAFASRNHTVQNLRTTDVPLIVAALKNLS